MLLLFAQVGATDSATIRAIHEERAELSQRVHEVRGSAARAAQQAAPSQPVASDMNRHVLCV